MSSNDGQKSAATDIEEAQDDSDDVLAKKYAEKTRQIFPQKIELPISTLTTMVDDQIDLNPDFQRRDVWDAKKQSKFIESLIMNVPIPPVFMGENQYGKYVVLDGRQRLTAIVKFMNNEYDLRGLEVWSELNKKRYSDLVEKRIEVSLTRRFLPAVILLKESSAEIQYDVFERLNTGGLNLHAMEIRNAIYRGEFTKLLHACSNLPEFRELWGIPADDVQRKKNVVYRRMRDIELVLRFFALRDAQEKKEKKRSAFKTYLGAFMARRNKEYADDSALSAIDLRDFETAVRNCLSILGSKAFFRKKDTRSAPLGDALMYALLQISSEQSGDSMLQAKIKDAVQVLLTTNSEFRESLEQGTNGRTKIERRLRLAYDAVKTAISSCT